MPQKQPDAKQVEMYRTLLAQIPAVVYIAEIGEPGEWLYVNPHIEQLLGYAPEEWMRGRRLWIDCIHPEDRPQILKERTDSKENGYFSSEYRMFARDGKEIWVRDEGCFSKDDSLCYGFLFDITEEKAAAEKAQAAEQQMEEERFRVEKRLRALNRFEAIGRLAAGVAHDFNNLLMAITSHCELLKLKISDSGLEELQEIQNAAIQGSVLTKHLLAFGGKQIQARQKVNLNQVLKNLEPMIIGVIGTGIQLEMIHATDLGIAEADLSQMEDMIISLAVMAAEGMPEGGRISFETANVEIDQTFSTTHADMKPGNYIQLSMHDTGPGLDEDAREHIFEPFYTRKDQTMGAGLRLPAVYGIVKQNGGYIWVTEDPNRGTTFRIYLPLVNAAIGNSVQERHEVQKPVAGQTILVVDDNDAVRIAISAYLEMKGFRVLQASNGKEAVQIAASDHKQKIDLLITDLIMPQMGGLELSQDLAKQNSNLKVLYMSGYTEESIIRQGVLKPGAFFLQKPVSMQMLLQKIRELL